MADLADDLRKAWRQWRELPNSRIIFYSRSNFGELAKLQERARKMPNSSAFLYDMPKSLSTAYFKLLDIGKASEGSPATTDSECYEFLSHLDFETQPDRTLKSVLLELLRTYTTFCPSQRD